MAKSKSGALAPSLDMLENGLDFIQSGVRYFMSSSKHHDYKYAVLHISSGVELILKERLRHDDYALIFQDTKKANIADFNSGNFVSTFFDEMIKRLKIDCEVVLANKALRSFKKLRNIRNQFEHFSFLGNPAQIQPVALSALSHILSFIHAHLDESLLSPKAAIMMEELQGHLNTYEEFAKVRLDQIKSELEDAEKTCTIELCPNCQRPALIINDDLCCRFCNFKEEASTMATLYAENILNESAHECLMHGGEFPVYDCNRCGESDTMVRTDDGYVCFSCGEAQLKDALSFCTNCGELFEPSDSEMCDDCWSYVFSKD